METNETRVGYMSLSIFANMLRDYTKMAIERKMPCEDEIIKLNALENYLKGYKPFGNFDKNQNYLRKTDDQEM